jgi:hypothetical protein
MEPAKAVIKAADGDVVPFPSSARSNDHHAARIYVAAKRLF